MGVIIRQKTKGKGQPWWVFITHNGKRTSRKVGAKDAAMKVASKIEAKLKLGEFGFEQPKGRVPTFKEYSKEFMTGAYAKTELKESTQDSYNEILKNHLIPYFGSMPINEITPDKIKSFLNTKIQSDYAIATVRLLKSYLSSIIAEALESKKVSSNPVHNLGRRFNKTLRPKNKSEDDLINSLTDKELKLLLDTAQEHFSSDYILFLLLARTGVRIGEALGLKWGDIDFQGRFIDVKRTYTKKRIAPTKSNNTRRVDMSLQLKEALKAHKSAAKKKGFALGLGDAPAYVFTNRVGSFIDVNNWRRRTFNKALEKAGLRKVRIHDIRHSYATIRIAKGDNIADVSKQLGHSSVKITMDIYYHWIPGGKKSQVDALDDVGYQEENKKAENE